MTIQGDQLRTTRKDPCRLATTADHGLTGLSDIDGVTPVAGDRILAKSQTATEENGIYIAASTAWARANDMDDVELDNITAGLEVYIQEGTASTKKTFVLTTTGTIVLDTTGLTFEEGPTAGAGASIAGSTGGTDNAILRADGTGGSTVKSSGVTISDADLVAGASGVLMPEQATSPSTSAGQGAFWVQDNAPSTPKFTDATADGDVTYNWTTTTTNAAKIGIKFA